MRRAPTSLVLLAALVGAGCAPAATAPLDAQAPARGAGDLAGLVDSVVSSHPVDRTQWGIHVTDLDGRVLYARNAEQLFAAASNTKLATIAAALDLLGPDHRWRTTVEAHGVEAGAANAVIVRGSGDPTLSMATLDSLADSLALAGIRRIAGPLIIDQGRFDSVLVHPAWENFDLDWYYAAPVAPFAVLRGAYPVVMIPGPVGAPARVELLVPAGLIGVDGRVRTVAGSDRWDDDLRRVAGTDSVVFRGEIGASVGPDTSWIAQDDPGRFAGRVFALALEERGITVEGPVVVTRDVAGLLLLSSPGHSVSWQSPPLRDVIRLPLEESDNWVSEQILKTLGAEQGQVGSWSGGTAVVEDWLAGTVGVAPGAMYIRDGSGLTSQSLLTPAALTRLLRYVATRDWAAAFRAAMVAPGEAGSTLEDRLVEYPDRLVAKTGTLRHVNALSGFATTAGGETRVFSILTNASGQPSRVVRRAMDRIVAEIIENGS